MYNLEEYSAEDLIEKMNEIKNHLINKHRYAEYLYFKDNLFRSVDAGEGKVYNVPIEGYQEVIMALDEKREEIRKYPILGTYFDDPWSYWNQLSDNNKIV